MSEVLLAANDIHKTYRMGKVPLHVLRGAGLKVMQGEILAITGASGCGKSTLMHIIGALDLPDRGRVRIAGTDVFALPARRRDALRNRDVGFVFQFYHLLPELTVLENTLMPRMVGSPVLGWPARRGPARESAAAILERVGLAERLRHRPNELSGGERPRVAIHRASLDDPRPRPEAT